MTKHKRNRTARIVEHPKLTPEMVDSRAWYALRVKSQKEFVTQTILKDRGLMSYVPVRKEWRHRNKFDRIKRQKTLISYPETVGYVFIGFTVNQLIWGNIPHWLKIFQIPTITGVLGVFGEPKQVDKGSLKRMVKKLPNGMQRPDREKYMRTHKEFKEGDTVLICNGPFEGHEVPVVEILGEKARLDIEFLGQKHEVLIDCFDLERAVA